MMNYLVLNPENVCLEDLSLGGNQFFTYVKTILRFSVWSQHLE